MEENTNIISLTDEEGVERDFEVITVLKVEETEYAILYDVDSREDEDAVVFRIAQDDEGSDILEVVEDDAEFDKVAAVYEEWLESEEDEEDNEDEE
ncbi:MAG: DUF1292 domain-containing protein [Clostridium sp.]